MQIGWHVDTHTPCSLGLQLKISDGFAIHQFDRKSAAISTNHMWLQTPQHKSNLLLGSQSSLAVTEYGQVCDRLSLLADWRLRRGLGQRCFVGAKLLRFAGLPIRWVHVCHVFGMVASLGIAAGLTTIVVRSAYVVVKQV